MNQPTNNEQNWELRYQNDDTPWRHIQAHDAILQFAEKYIAENTNILEIGCGTGEEAIALNRLGFNVLAIDIASTAIFQAKSKIKKDNDQLNFAVLDFIKEHHSLNRFDAIIDIACLHTFKTEIQRQEFANIVAKHLNGEGLWINLTCTKPAVELIEKKTGVKAPPALTLVQLAQATEQNFQLIEIQSTQIPVSRKKQPVINFPAWISVFKKISD